MTTTGTPLTDRAEAVRDLLAVLYPPPYEVVLGAPAAPGGRPRAGWTAVPSLAAPRLLVPEGSGRLASAVVRRQLTGTRWRTRAARAGLGLALGAGLGRSLRGRRVDVVGPAGAASIEDPLRALLDQPGLRLAMPVGPARANRKPVLQVTDPAGRALAFAKVGHSPLTARLVRREAAALEGLSTGPLPGVHAPRVLGLLTWAGCDVLVLEALDVPSRRLGGDHARRRLEAVVGEIAGLGGRSDVPWRDHPHREALVLGEPGGPVGAAVRRVVEEVDDGTVLPTGTWHGDLNSGNLALVPGRCPVWDWERCEHGVPVGFDLLHHDLHRMITVEGVPAAGAAARLVAAAPRTLAVLGVPAAVADAVVRLYLVTLAARYTTDDQVGAGADLGHVEQWLLPALGGGAR